MHLASSTLSDTVSAAAAPHRRAVVFRAPPSPASEPPHVQLLRRELRLEDSWEDGLLCTLHNGRWHPAVVFDIRRHTAVLDHALSSLMNGPQKSASCHEVSRGSSRARQGKTCWRGFEHCKTTCRGHTLSASRQTHATTADPLACSVLLITADEGHCISRTSQHQNKLVLLH